MTVVFKSIAHTAAAAASLMLLVAPSLADVVAEVEANSAAVNNTIATAQSLLPASFTPNVDPNVFGNLPTVTITGANGGFDVDFFAFQTGAGTGYFDIDNDPETFDSILSLFDSSGTLIAYDDDSSPEDPGTAFATDAFLGTYTFTQPGTYYVAVTTFSNYASATFNQTESLDLFRPDNAFGGEKILFAEVGNSSFAGSGGQFGSPYRLNISLSNPGVTGNPVPEPSEWLAMGMAAASVGGLMLRARRRRIDAA
jgi:hypothetical protein